ncbi:hypothetical protein GCM10010441_45190 [Kitasatospora paracochleata]|uniref:Serine/threonine protein phosphatase PrpC n=1 Tax=Kitasatospora paracochleata TaxID=58354 RepID=A0ABT1JBP5_9ACTN|nr:hypothetical protein [Kitasatospora paracochleata]MCP2314096.1 serine/threonine protein phosphatase PrpC [Kitasatospora paracochleata]
MPVLWEDGGYLAGWEHTVPGCACLVSVWPENVFPPTATNPYGGNRNIITSCLGSTYTDEETRSHYGHPAIETTTVPLTGPARLLLASDGAYEPHLDAGHDLFTELDDEPLTATARAFVDLAVETSVKASTSFDPSRPHADNATVLLANLTP